MATKRSLFKKPTWAAKEKSTVDEGRSIFQHNIYQDILQEKKKKEQRRLAEQKGNDGPQSRKGASRETKAEDDKQPTKKRRISVEAGTIDSDEDGSEDEQGSPPDHSAHSTSDVLSGSTERGSRSKKNRRQSSSSRGESPVLAFSPRKQKIDHAQHKSRSGNSNRRVQPESDDEVIVIQEVSSKPSPKATKSKSGKKAVPESESDSEADEYVKELKRAARAEAQSKKLQAVQDQAASNSKARSPLSAAPGCSHVLNSQRNSDTPTPLADASGSEVLIRIKTIIPNCNEVFVKRKASQTLEGLEKYFVETNKISDALRQKLFFTWNLQRLYKSTTMSSILAQIKAKYGTKSDGSDLSEGRIELEAVTVEILNLRKQQQERERRIANGEWEEVETTQGNGNVDAPVLSTEATEVPQPRKGIVIRLKSNNEKELPSMALRVHPDTTVTKIVRGYKSRMKVASEIDVYLMFEGERLEGEQLVGDIGFEDEDCVDVAAG